MFNKSLTAALALAAASLVSAQTYTECNPLEKTCPADPAFGADGANCDFTKGACDAFKGMDGTVVTYDSNGAKFAINKESDAPTMRSPNYIFFGRIDVVVQAAEGAGIVTSAVLQSDDLDEIDWEWVGGDNAQAQTNYFSKGDTSTYDRGAYHPVDAPLTSFHKYSVEWTSSYVNWLIDDAVVRTLNAADAKGADAFPQTPMQVKFGTWVAGGKNTAKGTVDWAGGYTNFDDAPFIAYYKSITIVDYAGKDSAGADATEYVYGDKSGSWESIEVKTDGSSNDKTTTTKSATKTTSKTTKTASATKTSEAETTETSESDKTTKDSDKTTKTATHTTLSTVTAATSGGSKTTDASSSEETGASASSTGTTSAPSETISTVPTNAAANLVGNMGLAAAGLLAVQFLI